jgi:hypothetical protein
MFGIDFNWDRTHRFASPGLYAQADPRVHLDWYRSLGVDTIQGFCVAHNGYAWYHSDIAPRTPGMNGSFSTRLAELAAAEGMDFVGFFSPGANEYWRYAHPRFSHPRQCPTKWHMPLTRHYNDYLASLVRESLDRIPMIGFMVDYLWSPHPVWMPCEQEMYEELLGEAFPAMSEPGASEIRAFQSRAVRRTWDTIRTAAKEADRDTIVWLNCSDLLNSQITESGVAREADWLMNEAPQTAMIEQARRLSGPGTRIVQCLCGWELPDEPHHDAGDIIRTLGQDPGIDLYGFAQPQTDTTLPDMEGDNPDARNLRAFRDAFGPR